MGSIWGGFLKSLKHVKQALANILFKIKLWILLHTLPFKSEVNEHPKTFHTKISLKIQPEIQKLDFHISASKNDIFFARFGALKSNFEFSDRSNVSNICEVTIWKAFSGLLWEAYLSKEIANRLIILAVQHMTSVEIHKLQ